MKNIVGFLLLLGIAFAQSVPSINLPQSAIDIENFALDYAIDPTNTHTIQTITQEPFTLTHSKRPFGYHKNKTLWWRFALNNDHNHTKQLFIYHKDGYVFDQTVFYILKKGTLVHHEDISRTIPVFNRSVTDASPTYMLTLQPFEEAVVYIQNRAQSNMLCNVQIMDAHHYTIAHLEKNVYFAFLFGTLFALGFYNLFLFFFIRRSEYFFYTLFIASTIAYLSYQSGLALELFNMSEAGFKRLLYGISLLQIGLILFSQKVLETKTRLPKVHKVLYGVLVLPSSMLVLGWVWGIDATLSMQAAFALLAAIVLLIAGAIALRFHIPEAKYYLLAMGFYLGFAIMGILMFFGILPYNDLTRNAFYFASLSEVFLLSLLLSYRIGLLRERAISSEQRLRHEIASRNALLLQQVHERTAQLDTLNKELEERIQHAINEIRKKDEDLLRQSRMAMMGEMISMIAHQWRQPLSTMMSVKHCMQLDISMGNIDPKALLDQLNDMENYIQYMSKTIHDFSDFFKPNKQQEEVRLGDLIASTLQLIKNRLEKAHVTVHSDIQTQEPLLTYKNELIQVFMMLFANALDALEAQKTPNATLWVTVLAHDAHQTIIIEDNAGGIEDAILPKVFEPYFSTKQARNGAGLGLYMSRTIIKEHCKGTITVKNGTYGAQLTLTLPTHEL